MKTIFITVYDGAISKNVLRTEILKQLRAKYHIVLFVPEKKKSYYTEHFATDSVHVEVTPPPDHAWFEAKFQSLALDLFHTESVRIKILHHYASRGNIARMLFKLLLWQIGRLKIVHRILRALYRRVPDSSFERHFDRYSPNLVFVPNMLSNEDYRMIKTASARGVPSIGMPKSWDNLTTKTFFNTFPDSVLVQSQVMKETAMDLFGYPQDNITVVGHPAFDVYAFQHNVRSREEFCQDLGLDPSRKIIVYAAGGSALAPHDEEVLSLLIEEINASPDLHGVQVLIRPHPKYEFDEKAIPRRDFVAIDNPGIRITQKKSSWEFLDNDIAHLMDTLMHMDLLISTASTLNLEGAIFDKPLLSVAFDGHVKVPYALSVARYYQYEHLKPLVDSGGMGVAYSKEDLFSQVRRYLLDPAQDRTGRGNIVEKLVWKADGQSGKRVAEAIIRVMP